MSRRTDNETNIISRKDLAGTDDSLANLARFRDGPFFGEVWAGVTLLSRIKIGLKRWKCEILGQSMTEGPDPTFNVNGPWRLTSD